MPSMIILDVMMRKAITENHNTNHVETPTGHLEALTGHLEARTGHVEAPTGHFGSRHNYPYVALGATWKHVGAPSKLYH